MRNLIVFIVVFFAYSSFAKELVVTSHSTSTIDKFNLPSGITYSNFTNTGTWTDNFGNYGTFRCFGLVKTHKSGEIELDIVCENSDKKSFKNWIILKRSSTQFETGVGVTEFIDGTGPWKEVIGTKCNYAVNYLGNVSFTIDKCKLSEKAYNALSKH